MKAEQISQVRAIDLCAVLDESIRSAAEIFFQLVALLGRQQTFTYFAYC
jgi:hypothetical protein